MPQSMRPVYLVLTLKAGSRVADTAPLPVRLARSPVPVPGMICQGVASKGIGWPCGGSGAGVVTVNDARVTLPVPQPVILPVNWIRPLVIIRWPMVALPPPEANVPVQSPVVGSGPYAEV